jgi:hypothetical protein
MAVFMVAFAMVVMEREGFGEQLSLDFLNLVLSPGEKVFTLVNQIIN